MKTIACTFAIYNFCIPLKLTTFVCSTVIDNFGCSTIKLTTYRPMKELADRLTNIVTYIVAIASKNIQIFSWGWGSVTKQLFFFTYTD